MFNTSAVTS